LSSFPAVRVTAVGMRERVAVVLRAEAQGVAIARPLAWDVGKSALPFQVRRFTGRQGNEVVMLVDRGRGPAFYPTVFLTCCYEKSGESASTREMVLRAIGMAHAWADARGRDFDDDLRHGSFLSLADVEALADHLMLSVEAQATANAVTSAPKNSPRSGSTVDLERFRPRPERLAAVPGGIEPGNAFSRIKWVARYVEWHLQQRLGVADRSGPDCPGLRHSGPQALARLRERGRGNGRRALDNEALEGVPQEVIDLVSNALRPGNPLNPFEPGFLQARNELLWHVFVSSGGRRSEVQSVLVKDVTYSQRRLFFSTSKTRTRTVSISQEAADQFERFIEDHWAGLPQAARRRGYLFTGKTGEHLSPRAVGRVFEAIRERVPGCPDFLTAHTTRRSWNDRFSEKLDALPPEKRIPAEQEMRARNMLQGWSPTSSMGALYANRHLRRKADELGEQLANAISKRGRDPSDD
jgi:integrase